MQLPVGKARPQPVGHPHGKGRLTDPGLAADRRDDNRGRQVPLQQLLHLRDGSFPAGKVVDVRRELTGPSTRPRLLVWHADLNRDRLEERRVGSQDGLFQLLQGRAGFQAELLDQHIPAWCGTR